MKTRQGDMSWPGDYSHKTDTGPTTVTAVSKLLSAELVDRIPTDPWPEDVPSLNYNRLYCRLRTVGGKTKPALRRHVRRGNLPRNPPRRY